MADEVPTAQTSETFRVHWPRVLGKAARDSMVCKYTKTQDAHQCLITVRGNNNASSHKPRPLMQITPVRIIVSSFLHSQTASLWFAMQPNNVRFNHLSLSRCSFEASQREERPSEESSSER